MIERILSRAQGRAILAMVRERAELTRQANEQIAEINAGMEAQAETLRLAFGLPEGQYRFEGDAREVKLVGQAEAVLAAQRAAAHAEVAAEDADSADDAG